MKDDELTSLSAVDVGEGLFRRLFHKHSSILLLVHPDSGALIDANRAAAAFYGYSEEMLRRMKISDINILTPEEIRAEMQLALHEQRNYFTFRHRLASGEVRIVEVHSSAIDTRDGTLLFSIVFDVTLRKQAEASLRLASLVYQNSSEAMSIATTEDVIVAVNPAFTRITGFTAEEAIGRHASIIRSWRTDFETRKEIRRIINATGNWTGEIWAKRKDGEEILCRVTINAIHEDDGTVQRLVCQFSDITSQKKSDELIWRQANFDTLTGLSNRSMFQDRLEQALKKAQRDGTSVALLFIDLDWFKEVNDTLGHDTGDKLLKVAAQRLLHCVRESDTVARVGGDEFAVIVADVMDVHNVERVVHAILQSMSDTFHIGSEEVYLSASIGITFYPDDGTDSAVLLKNADQAMYAAKEQGRNRFRFFTSSMQEAAQARKRIIADLRVALAENQFSLHYQPIVDLRTGAIHKAEALVRWQHPEHGTVSPAAFVRIAEETGMIVELGEWVFREAVRQAVAWSCPQRPHFQVSINVSPVQFHSGGIDHDAWLSHLAQLQLPGHNVVVEITEGMLMDGRPEITEQLLRFRDSGVQVALDDFGTGYSSLSYLKKFDIDYIKIDQAFVRNLAPGSEDLALCEAMIVMAHKLGLKVIAEGVETEEQRALLAESGCDYAQGYLFSKPVPAAEFEKLLERFATT
jgi:diguanylate cyclase (GGDEF)-like protein/PAS domain S-box-containing protein